MSDYPQGPGWWQASDGRWYPPQEPTAAQPPQTSPYPPYQSQGAPPPPRKSKGPLIALLVAVAVVAAALVGFVIVATGDDEQAEAPDDAPATTAANGDETTTTADGGGGGLDVEAPEGFVPFVSEDEGFAILLPEEWREFDLSDPAVQAQLDDFIGENPRMGRALSSAEDIIASGGVLLAIDPVRTPFGPNINMIKSPGETNLELLDSLVVNQLEPIGATNITTDIVELPVGEALAIDYDLPLNLPEGGSIEVHGRQFQVPAAGSTWAITMTTDDIDRDGDMFDVMIGSFTVEG